MQVGCLHCGGCGQRRLTVHLQALCEAESESGHHVFMLGQLVLLLCEARHVLNRQCLRASGVVTACIMSLFMYHIPVANAAVNETQLSIK